jgi:hypothetical protein
VESQGLWNQILEIPFFAFSPGRHPAGLVPVYAVKEKGKSGLTLNKPGKQNSGAIPLFYALPGEEKSNPSVLLEKSHESPGSFMSPMIVPLYEFKDSRGHYFYSTEDRLAGFIRSENPACRVWKNPASGLLLDPGVKPVSAF